MRSRKARDPGKDRGDRPILLPVRRFEQPDDLTCGPTCLAQIYRYYGDPKPVSEVIAETPANPDGGTLAVYLGISALRNGFDATLYSYNLWVFDPTWFDLPPSALLDKLGQRLASVSSRRLKQTIRGYVNFLEMGGRVRFADLDEKLLAGLLAQRRPILTGLSATYLYRTAREHKDEYDDIRGEPVGHFVVVSGYYPKTRRFLIRDPATHIPFSRTGKYSVSVDRLIASIMLGVATYDAVLLVVKPRKKQR
ncbi:MAG: hypothetical protein PVI01_09870 [Gemmatimonadales bacterium]|jgi:hypothetical protein